MAGGIGTAVKPTSISAKLLPIVVVVDASRAIAVIEAMTRHQPPEKVAKLWAVHLQQPRFERDNRNRDPHLVTLYNEGMRMVGQLVEAHNLMGMEWPWAKPPPAGEFRRRAGGFLEAMGLLEAGGWI